METQSAFMAAAAAAVLLIAVLRDRRDRTALLFGALTSAFALWSLARGAEGLGWAWGTPATGVSLALLGALAPMNAAAFTGFRETLKRYRGVLLFGPLLLCGLVLLGGAERPLVRFAAGGWALSGVIGATILLARFGPAPGEESSPDATRLRYLAVAHGVIAVGAGIDLAAWRLGAPRVAALLAPLLYLYAGYLHLLRVRVADLRQLMGNTISLSFLALALATSFAALWLFVGPRLDLFVFNSFVASFVLLLLLDPSRRRIQRAMDRRFVASRLELERTLVPLLDRLPHVFTLDELLSDVLDTVERTNRLRTSVIFLREDPHVGFQQVGSVGLPPRRRIALIRHPAWVETLEAGEVLLLEEVEKALAEERNRDAAARLEALLRLMRELDAQLVLPLRSANHLVGFWTLSDQRQTEPFSSTEVDLLRSVADQIAGTIETSKTFERVRARERLASLGEMAAGLAHEIRNPLATIRGAVALLEDPEEQQGDEIRRVIVDEISRLDRVVGTFLDYAKPAVAPSPIPEVGEFVRSCVQGVARRYAASAVELEFELEGGLPAPTANADQLERVVVNLVENAYQALGGSGSIRVAVCREEAGDELGECVDIVIEDDGPGMDEITRERAVLPFFTTKETGIGLGLALCERLVQAQGGTLRLRSRPGAGTAVVVRLPCHAPAADPADDPGSETGP